MLQEPVSVKLGDEWKHVLVRGRQVPKRVSSYGYRVHRYLTKSSNKLKLKFKLLIKVDNTYSRN